MATLVIGDCRLRFSNAEYSMQYSVVNDNRNIYVCVYSKDESFKKTNF